jgi:hypothetical protein
MLVESNYLHTIIFAEGISTLEDMKQREQTHKLFIISS